MAEYHQPVLLEETIDGLAIRPGTTVVDATLGAAGHARAIAEKLGPNGLLLGIDRDKEALEVAREHLLSAPSRTHLVHSPFGQIRAVLDEVGVGPTADSTGGVEGLLADLGVSSHQLDERRRGFSFMAADAPLDMRMDQSSGQSAADLLTHLEQDELRDALRELGDVRHPGRLARAMVEDARAGRLTTCGQLAGLVTRVLPKPKKRKRIHPATTVFQTLRMLVNDELGNLRRLFDALPDLMKPGGRVAIISFHSVEDRIVKRTFRRWAGRPIGHEDDPVRRAVGLAPIAPPTFGRIVTRRPVSAGESEIAENPRARSAKLRVFEFLGEED